MSAWISWIIATLFLCYQFILRTAPGAMVDEIIAKFDITPSMFGHVSGAYYLAYVLAHIPIGMMLDHFGTKKVISSCIAVTILGTLPIVYSESYLALNLGRILVGIGSSAGVLGVFKVLRMNFSENKFAFLLGISITIGYCGAAYAGMPIKSLIGTIGMENTVLTIISMGVMLLIVALLALDKHSEEKFDNDSIIQDLKTILVNKEWLLISFFGGLMIGPLEGFADGWSIKFLSVYYPAMQSSNAAFLTSLIFLGMAFTAPLIGYITQKTPLKQYYLLLVFLGLILLCSFCSILLFKFSIFFIGILFALLGFASNYQTIVIVKATTFASKEKGGLVSSCSNMIIMIFGYLFHIAIGGMIGKGGGTYSEELFFKSLAIIPIALAIATLFFLALHIKKTCSSSNY